MVEVGVIVELLWECDHLGDGPDLLLGSLSGGVIQPCVPVQTLYKGSLHSIYHLRHIALEIIYKYTVMYSIYM